MCGRFTLTVADWEELSRLLGVDPGSTGAASASYRPRYNVAPTDAHWIVRDGVHESAHLKELVGAAWGLGGSHGKPQLLARVETPSTRGRLRDPEKHGRCVIAADGFFEWTGEKGDRRPVWFHRPEGGLCLLGGLCAESKDGLRFAVLTTAANDVVARVHDRMPVIVPTNALERFLRADEDDLAKMLVPAPKETLVAREVSKRVNAVANDDPSCLDLPDGVTKEGAPKKKKGKQLGLF